jgi:hypothetical protein
MFPNVAEAFSDWTSAVQMKVVNKEAVDFEVNEQVLKVVAFDAVMQPIPPQRVDRKPEGQRIWKWWEMWADTSLAPDTVVQDQNGLQFRIQSVQDWSQAGYFHYELTEQPPQ